MKETAAQEQRVTKLKEVYNFLGSDSWKLITDILRDFRTQNIRSILTAMNTDEKIYSETDMKKREIMAINRFLRLRQIIETDLNTEEAKLEEMLSSFDSEELDIGDEDDIFTTKE